MEAELATPRRIVASRAGKGQGPGGTGRGSDVPPPPDEMIGWIMTDELLSLVLCPRCRGTVEVAGDPPEGLRCPSCGAVYPVVGRVPRLAGDTYAASFGRQWNRYDVARPEEDEATFRVKTGVAPGSLAGKLVLDAGCGGGGDARPGGGPRAPVVGGGPSSPPPKAPPLWAGLPAGCT